MAVTGTILLFHSQANLVCWLLYPPQTIIGDIYHE
jgi:hypothetical protein